MLMISFFSNPASLWGSVKKPNPLIGSKAKAWFVADWFNSKALELDDLNQKVVLIRWWTAPSCPYCRNSAAALNEFYEQYHNKGLEVIGFYHHKSSTSFSVNTIKKYSSDLGFQFPVAIDYDWKTLREWWLNHSKEKWTSVSFLIDKEGIIRYIHPGGQYVKGDEDYRELKSMIETLLAQD